MELAVVLGLIIALLLFAGWRGARQRMPSLPASEAAPSHPYHCVTIEARGQECEAARSLAGKRFLAAHAPRLPLSGCSSGNCRCVYLHYEDRRHHNRRDPYVHAQRMRFGDIGHDRRSSPGRRKTDLLSQPMP